MDNRTNIKKNIKFVYDIEIEDLNNEILNKIINMHKQLVKNRFQVLEDYYEGKHAILNRFIADDKPNNRSVFNYCRYVTDNQTGYFMGKPISYSSKNTELLEKLKENNRLNNEELENNNLAHKASVKGTSYALCYLNERGEFRWKALDTDSVILILDTTINNNVKFAIRYYYTQSLLEEEDKLNVEIYTENKILKFELNEDNLIFKNEEAHYFGEVPIIEFANNRYRSGDFEFVVDINDSINKLNNDIANDLDYYSNCLLALTGLDQTDEKAIEKLEKREGRTMFLPHQSDAKFITKNINNNVVEYNHKNLLEALHQLAAIPDLTKINFSGDMKATTVKSMFFYTEQIVAEKERNFKIGKEKLIRLFCRYLNLKRREGAEKYDWRDIEIQFNRNIPVNLAEFGDSVIKLKGTLPTQIILEELKKNGLEIDVNRAMELIEKEQEVYKFDNSFPTYSSEGDLVE